MADTPTPFQISRISIQGGIGAGLLIAVIVASVLESLPVLRWPVLGGMAVGTIVAGSWILARRRRPLEARTPPLSLGLYEDPRRPH